MVARLVKCYLFIYFCKLLNVINKNGRVTYLYGKNTLSFLNNKKIPLFFFSPVFLNLYAIILLSLKNVGFHYLIPSPYQICKFTIKFIRPTYMSDNNSIVNLQKTNKRCTRK
jgi:hypothetical protein